MALTNRQLRRRVNRLSGQLGTEGADNAALAGRIQTLQGRQQNRGMRVTGAQDLSPYLSPTPSAPAAPTTPAATNQPGFNRSVDNFGISPYGANPGRTFFPSIRAFEPAAYEGSPLYDFQLKEGQKALNRRLSASGLLGSGRDIEAHGELATRLAASEADKSRDIAEREADRYYTMMQDESMRRERAGNSQFDRTMRVLETMLSQNPLQYGYGAATNMADMDLGEGRRRGNVVADLYPRHSIGAGSGYSAAPMPRYIAPFPDAPDFSGANMAQAVGNNANMTQWGNLFSSLAGLL